MSTIIEHPNTMTVRRLYDAINAKDMETLTALISPDVTFVMPGQSPLAGIYDGRDALFGFFGKLAAATDGTYNAELRELYASDAQVVAVHHGTGTRGEMTLDADAALVFELSDGLITAVIAHQRRQDEWDGFFS